MTLIMILKFCFHMHRCRSGTSWTDHNSLVLQLKENLLQQVHRNAEKNSVMCLPVCADFNVMHGRVNVVTNTPQETIFKINSLSMNA